jgi:DNA-binding CsgD family transcriptional regulator
MRRSAFILAIDSYLVRKGLVSLLHQIPGLRILQEFSHTGSLLSFLHKQPVDFIIISQKLFEASFDLFVQDPPLLEKIILLKEGPEQENTPHNPGPRAHASIHLGEEKEQILEKIQGLLEDSDSSTEGSGTMELSPRETTIVRLVSLGLTNRQIAEHLYLSAHTVMTHRKNISSKLGIKSVSGLTVYAIVNNIITIEEVTSKPKE